MRYFFKRARGERAREHDTRPLAPSSECCRYQFRKAMAVRLSCFSPPVLQWSELFQIRFASDFTRLFSGRLLCTITPQPSIGTVAFVETVAAVRLLSPPFFTPRFGTGRESLTRLFITCCCSPPLPSRSVGDHCFDCDYFCRPIIGTRNRKCYHTHQCRCPAGVFAVVPRHAFDSISMFQEQPCASTEFFGRSPALIPSSATIPFAPSPPARQDLGLASQPPAAPPPSARFGTRIAQSSRSR